MLSKQLKDDNVMHVKLDRIIPCLVTKTEERSYINPRISKFCSLFESYHDQPCPWIFQENAADCTGDQCQCVERDWDKSERGWCGGGSEN